jgi:hypothetical protein
VSRRPWIAHPLSDPCRAPHCRPAKPITRSARCFGTGWRRNSRKLWDPSRFKAERELKELLAEVDQDQLDRSTGPQVELAMDLEVGIMSFSMPSFSAIVACRIPSLDLLLTDSFAAPEISKGSFTPKVAP